MDKLIRFVEEHRDSDTNVDSKEFAELVILANEDLTYESANPDVLSSFRAVLEETPTCSADTLQPIVEKLFPAVFGKSDYSSRSNSHNQMVPESSSTSSGAASRSPMDSVKRTSTFNHRISGSPVGSASEGARLLRKNYAKLDDKELDAAANNAKTKVIDSMARYATFSGRLSPPRPTISTNSERLSERRLSYSESDVSVLETPKADRRVVRTIVRTSPEREVPNTEYSPYKSPDNSFDATSHYFGNDATSPSRQTARDEVTPQYIDGLLHQITKLKRDYRAAREKHDMDTEKYEIDTNSLRDKLQEANAGNTKARREIEKLKEIVAKHQRACNESELRVSELTVEINNLQTKTNDLKKQLDKKISTLTVAEARLLDQAAHIRNLTIKTKDDEKTRAQLERRICTLEYEEMTLKNDLSTAYEEKKRADGLQQKNSKLQADLESLQKRLKEVSAQVQLSRTHGKDGDEDMLSDMESSIRRRAKSGAGSLYDELQNNDVHDLSGVDDVAYERSSTRNRGHSDPSTLASTSIGNIAELDMMMRDRISKLLTDLSPEDWLFLCEVWKRVEKCDDDDNSEQQLRSDVLATIANLDKNGLKSSIRSRNNPKLDRIVNNVSRSLGSNSISHGVSSKG
ncbi:hypothetical protein GGI05_003292, partial [Coemansia sp. RSA 2603]